MTVLVFGRSGQVARELTRQGGVTTLGRSTADLSAPGACAAAIAKARPKAVVNAAAYTAVDAAEGDEATAMVVNGEAPGEMARACAAAGIPLVQLSTDYVFSGDGDRPWKPDDPTGPIGAYGRSKLAGEQAVRTAGGTHAILRTSWVVSAHGSNFVKTMLRLGAERDRLTVVSDQIGGPTPARALATACLDIAEALMADPAKTGTYHLSGAPDVSWAAFARDIFAQAGLDCAIDDISTDAYPTLARRPLNSHLDCSTTEATFGLRRPDWRMGLADILAELGAAGIAK